MSQQPPFPRDPYQGQWAGGPYPPPPGSGPTWYAPPPTVPQTSQNAIVALVISALGWVVCPIAGGVVALVIASNARREIRASNGWRTGDTLVTTAKWLAWSSIIFYIVVMIFYAALIALAIVLDGGDGPHPTPSPFIPG